MFFVFEILNFENRFYFLPHITTHFQPNTSLLNSSLGKSLQWYVDNGWLPAIPDEGEVPANLEDCSWNMIQQLVQADTFKNYYKVGDTKSITLSSGEVVYMQVASINNGEGDAGVWYPKGTVDFIARDCLSTFYALSSSGKYGDIGGWSGCSLRSQLNTGILNTLPIDVQNVIIEKTHSYYAAASGYVEATDKLWLPTVYELIGSNYNSNEPVLGNQIYPIFSGVSLVKNFNGGGVTSWWTSSDSTSAYASANSVSYTGALTITSSNVSAGIPICFRVG